MTRVADVLPLSPLQEGLLFHARHDDRAWDAYTVQLTVRLHGPLDVDRLRRAGDAVLERHPNLRSAFRDRKSGGPVAVIPDVVRLPLSEVDLSDLPEQEREAELRALADADRVRRFDLAVPPALRCAAITLGPERHVLLLTCHHILLDGWSMPLLLAELGAAYAEPDAVRPTSTVYREYLRWLAGRDRDAAARAWRSALAGLGGPTRLVPDAGGAALPVQTHRELSEERTTALVETAKRAGVTLNTLVQLAFGVLLARMTGRDDIVFGTTVSGRPAELPGADTALGLFINTLPVRVRLPHREPVSAALARVQDEQAALLEHHHLGLAEIQRLTGFGELFDTLLVFQNHPRTSGWPDGFAVADVNGVDATHYPFSLVVAPGERLALQATHRPDMVPPEAADRLLDRLVGVFDAIVADPEASVGSLDVVTPAERERMLVHWVDAAAAREPVAGDDLPIGRPVPGDRAYVLDARARLLPPGAVGELHLAGTGLPRGDVRRPGATADRFRPDPFGPPGSRMYRTGDLARWRADGRLEHLGRVDHQVKGRGSRIEPGEVESVLARHPAVAAAAVVVRRDGGDRRLVAYAEPVRGRRPDTAELRRHVASALPDHMVPSVFVVVDALPLQADGKPDRTALPEPPAQARAELVGTPTEQTVAAVWADVLGTDHVGVDDDFFDLGGHSLLAVRVVARLGARFGIALSTGALFANPTVAALAEHIDGRETGTAPIVPAAAALRTAPLSFGQRRLWLLEQSAPGSSAYHVPLALRLRGELDVAALAHALSACVRRHEVLRTRFTVVDGEPRQVVDDFTPLTPGVTHVPDPDDLDRLLGEAVRAPFDLERGPVLRAHVFRLGDRDHVLLLVVHHIAFDEWSAGVFTDELATAYRAFRTGSPAPVAGAHQYADFAVWQQDSVGTPAYRRQLDHWRARLAGAPAVLELPTDRPVPPTPSFRGAERRIRIGPEQTARLRALARSEQATVFTVLLAVTQVLLSRHSGQDDVCVGTVTAGRGRQEWDRLVGFFANTLVLRGDLSGDPPFREFLRRTRSAVLDAYENQDVPFEELVEQLAPPRVPGRNPLFQAMFVMADAQHGGLDLPGVLAEPLDLAAERAKFDLTFTAVEGDDHVDLFLAYATDLFADVTAARLVERFGALLDALLDEPDRRIGDAPVLTAHERRALGTATEHHTGTVHALVETQARRTPDAVAVVFGPHRVTYRALDERANQLARHLRDRGIGPESVVAVHAERSVELVVALLAVLKTGGAYLPVEPEYPAERIAFMLADARPELVLTQQHLATALPPTGVPTIRLDADAHLFAGLPTGDLGVEPDGDNLVYVIHTSGSTGRPKGAANTQRAVANRLLWMQRRFPLDATDAVLQKTPIGFDVSAWEFFWPLITGARLVLAEPGAHRDPVRLADLVAAERVTTLHFVPSVLRPFLAVPDLARRCASLRRVLCSGEALTPDLQRRFHEVLSAELHNLYGPAEAAIDVTHWACAPDDDPARVPIGHAIDGVRALVLDRRLRPVPAGAVGEIFLGGVGLGRGYLHRPALTAERFLPDPFTRGARLYRTGDLGRTAADGALEYLGRTDHQVKLRGVRVEPGEVESVLADHPAVDSAAVTAVDEGGEPALLAFAVPAGPVRALLRPEDDAVDHTRLPNGMVVHHHRAGETAFLFREIFERRTYLRNGVALPDDAVVFDVGANIGLFTLFAASTAHRVRVFAFEPLPANVDLLRRNVDLHGVDATVAPYGLADHDGEVEFTHYPHMSLISGQFADSAEDRRAVRAVVDASGHGGDDAVESMLDDLLAARQVTGRVRRLSDVLHEHDVSRVDLLKIDVERAELAVLEGVDERDWPKIRQVVVEVHDIGGRVVRVRELLSRHGFTTVVEEDDTVRGSGLHTVYARAGDPVEPGTPPEPGRSDPQALAADLREHLASRLPAAMVPAAVTLLPELPLSLNGKLDRAALHALDRGVRSGSRFVPPTTPAEQTVAQVWADVLDRRVVGAHDDFFALGGHSLSAMRMIALLARRTRVEVSVGSLFTAPTVRRFARLVEDGGGRGPLVPLHVVESDRTPLVLVHPVGGGVLCYADLVRALPDRRVYGLTAPGLDGRTPPATTIDDLAAGYVAALEDAGLRDRCVLGGWSMGGLVAFEVAERIHRATGTAPAVLMIDTHVDTGADAADDADVVVGFAEDWGRSAGVDLAVRRADVVGLDPAARVDLVVRRARSLGVLGDDSAEVLTRLLDVFRAHVHALAHHRPEPGHGDVTLLSARDSTRGGDPDHGWRALVGGRFDLRVVPGDHYSVLRAVDEVKSVVDEW